MNWLFIVFTSHGRLVVYVDVQKWLGFGGVDCDLNYVPMQHRESVKCIFHFGSKSRRRNYLVCDSYWILDTGGPCSGIKGQALLTLPENF